MNTTTLASSLALAALLAGATAGCTSTLSREDAALDRAYQSRVEVTGTRIRQRVDTRNGNPDVGFPLDSMSGYEAQEAVRQMREMRLYQPRRR